MDDIRKLLFSVFKCEMAETSRKEHEGKAPHPLNSQYPKGKQVFRVKKLKKGKTVKKRN